MALSSEKDRGESAEHETNPISRGEDRRFIFGESSFDAVGVDPSNKNNLKRYIRQEKHHD